MTDRLNCFICNNFVNAGLNGLLNHLNYGHRFTINKGYGRGGFICGKNGFQRSFTLFTSMSKHIRCELLGDRIEKIECKNLESHEYRENTDISKNA